MCAKCLPPSVVAQNKSVFKRLNAVAVDWNQLTRAEFVNTLLAARLTFFWKQAELARRENWKVVAPTKELVIFLNMRKKDIWWQLTLAHNQRILRREGGDWEQRRGLEIKRRGDREEFGNRSSERWEIDSLPRILCFFIRQGSCITYSRPRKLPQDSTLLPQTRLIGPERTKGEKT